tara:strand:+ start:989 stop:1147 length:159 start_codon:yes stop_codon:yes gene_type:complete
MSNFFDNMRAKKARGEKPAKPGEKDYPTKKAWKKITAKKGLKLKYKVIKKKK